MMHWRNGRRILRQPDSHLSLYEQNKHYNKTTYPDVPAVVTEQVMKRLQPALTAYVKGRKEGRAVASLRYKPPQRWHSIEFRNGPNALDGCYCKALQQCSGRMWLNLHCALQGPCKSVWIVTRPSGWYLQCAVRLSYNRCLRHRQLLAWIWV
jgi:hypothetical protein